MVKKSFCHFLDIINKQSPSEMPYTVGAAEMLYPVGAANNKNPDARYHASGFICVFI